MNATMKVLIENSTRVRKLPRPTGVGVVGIAEIGAEGIVGSVTVLGPLGMSVTARQD